MSHLAGAASSAPAAERALAVARGIRRTDQETLKAAVELCDWGLEVVYVWCINDPDGEDDGWRVLDLHPATATATDADGEDGEWYPTIAEAEEAFASKAGGGRTFAAPAGEELNDDNDDYWNMYDHASDSEASAAAAAAAAERAEGQDSSEDAYFSRYDAVVPALDCGAASSPVSETCRRYSLGTATTAEGTSTPPTTVAAVSPPATTLRCPAAATAATTATTATTDNPNTTTTTTTAAPGYSPPQMDASQTEVAVKQHMSMSIKSLYRLAKAAGISRDEFESIVHTELSVLSMMDEDDDC